MLLYQQIVYLLSLIVFILYLFLVYWKSYLFLFIVNQYMCSKFK